MSPFKIRMRFSGIHFGTAILTFLVGVVLWTIPGSMIVLGAEDPEPVVAPTVPQMPGATTGGTTGTTGGTTTGGTTGGGGGGGGGGGSSSTTGGGASTGGGTTGGSSGGGGGIVVPVTPPTGGTTTGATTGNASSVRYNFQVNLTVGTDSPDVKLLQQFLNAQGFVVATSGVGSPGNETTYLGPRTSLAVKAFQEKYAADILKPLGLTSGTGFLGTATRTYINTHFYISGGGSASVPTTPSTPTGGCPTPIAYSRPLTVGLSGADVTWLQQVLSTMPDIYPQKITSGYFGELTKAAVGAFQIKQGIVSGVAQVGYGGVGPLTYAKLLAMCPK